MYTGIVTGTFPIIALERREASASFTFAFDQRHLEGLEIGASVSLNGCCMSVTQIEGEAVSFDASGETLRKTNLGDFAEGDLINVERSAKAGAEVGGHPMSGHVDGCATIVEVERTEENCSLTFEFPAEFARYVFNKGFIGLNGCSLTVSDLEKATGRFKVYLIPETLRQTTYDTIAVGARVNFEIDRQTQVLVDTVHDAVRQVMAEVLPRN